ncbi:MAG: hypothetical protein WA984_05615 [Phormidesmis sp.]
MNRLSVQVAEGDYDGVANFEFGLELILEGLEKYHLLNEK